MGELDPHVGDALDGDSRGVALRFRSLRGPQRQEFLLGLLGYFVRSRVLDQMGDHILRGHLPLAYRREHGVGIQQVEIVGHSHKRLRREQCGNR